MPLGTVESSVTRVNSDVFPHGPNVRGPVCVLVFLRQRRVRDYWPRGIWHMQPVVLPVINESHRYPNETLPTTTVDHVRVNHCLITKPQSCEYQVAMIQIVREGQRRCLVVNFTLEPVWNRKKVNEWYKRPRGDLSCFYS